MPSLPRELFKKFTDNYKLSSYDALNIIEQKEIANYFESIVNYTKNYKAAANWLMGSIKSHLNQQAIGIDSFAIAPKNIALLIEMIDQKKISHSLANQKVFPEMLKNPSQEPEIIAKENNWMSQQNEDNSNIITKVFNENPNETERYKNGEKKLTGFFMGQIMKASKGTVDPKKCAQLLQTLIHKT